MTFSEQVAADIYRIPVPLPGNPLRNLNAYLVRGEERSLLIDTGFRMPACRSAIEEALHELNVSMDQTDIFLTHLHSDHTGLAPELAAPSSRVFISEIDRSFMPGCFDRFDWNLSYRDMIANGFPAQVLEETRKNNPAAVYAAGPFDRYETIGEGDELHYGGYCLKPIATPGHTPGHLCLYIPEEQILFLGDHVLFDITPNITSWLGIRNSLADYRDSLKKIQALPVRLPLPAHRTVHTDLSARIDALLQHHEQRCAEVLYILCRYPESSGYEIAGRMTWSIRCRDWNDFPAGQKYFAVGEALAHIDDLIDRGLVERTVRAGKYFYRLHTQS